jgi:hypothetical protein
MTKEDVLTEDFLFELYYACFSYDYVCNMVCRHMRKEYLPGRDFQALHGMMKKYYTTHQAAPTPNIIGQVVAFDKEVAGLVKDIKDCAQGASPGVILKQFEDYIRQVRFQCTYREVGEMYAQKNRDKAMKLLQEFAEWQNNFTLEQNAFVDVTGTFEPRFYRNREKHNMEGKRKPVSRFYIDGLDEMNEGRDLRGQLTCFLAATGVGKSHIARWVGKCAAQVDGLDVLHIQLEGSEDEVVDAYAAALVSCNPYRYSTGTLKDRDFAKMVEQIKAVAGTLKVRAFPRFANQISTLDVKNLLAEYRKLYGKNPDVLIVDSMDLLTDSSGRKWTEAGERHRRIAVANDLKDLASDENIWVVTTYQATIENQDWLNDEKNVLTEYNCAEAKGLARPMTHLITLNQSRNEAKENLMRLYVAKSRFFKKGEPIRIATDYDNERFYDRQRTMTINKAA